MVIRSPKSPSDTFDVHFRTDRLFDVVGFGMNSVDHLCVVSRYPHIDSKTDILQYAKLPGGQIATALTFLSRSGLRTKYIGKVGSDDLGQFSLRSLQAESIDISSVLVEQTAPNQFAVIIVDQSCGERTILCQRHRNLDFKASELEREDVCAGKLLHLDGYDSAASLRAATMSQEQGIPVSMDLDRVVPHCTPLIEKVDFLIVSSNFPADLTGIANLEEALRALRSHCRGFLAVTRGTQGAVALVGDQCVVFPGYEVKAVDTTGAGDIFHAGFIYGLMQNWPLGQIMNFANAAAALSCTCLGARTGIRPLRDILKFMDQARSAT